MAMPIAIALVLVAVGSMAFHLLAPWWLTPIASNWRYIDVMIAITFWITGLAFTSVVLFMAYCVFRFQHRVGNQAAYQPENKRLEWWLAVLTGVGVAARHRQLDLSQAQRALEPSQTCRQLCHPGDAGDLRLGPKRLASSGSILAWPGGHNLLPILFPLASRFALLGPLAGVSLNE